MAPCGPRGPVCSRLGTEPVALLAGSRGGPECAVRAAIAHVACDGVGVTCAETPSGPTCAATALAPFLAAVGASARRRS